MLLMSNAEMLIHAFMTSRLDYCNALLGGCSARLINKLQMVQNAAARVLTRNSKYDHMILTLSLFSAIIQKPIKSYCWVPQILPLRANTLQRLASNLIKHT